MGVISKPNLKKLIPLYPVLVNLVLEFLEPCIDYTTSECTHVRALCPSCDNVFEFRSSLFGPERILLENFCPMCGVPNPHQTGSSSFPFMVKIKRNLKCPGCLKCASSYEHKFCTACGLGLVLQVF